MRRFLLLIACLLCVGGSSAAQGLLRFVDTRVGTAASVTRSAGQFGRGTEEYAHTLPAVLAPFGMNFWTPQTQATEQKGVCPYLYKHSRIQGFRCSHWIVGGCTQDYGSFTVQPVDGRVVEYLRSKRPYCADSLSSSFSHDREVATPAYYRVGLDDYGIQAELTATERAAMLRLTYVRRDSAYLLVTVNSDEGEGEIFVNEDGLISGKNPAHRIYQGWGKPTGHAGYFVLRCNAEYERVERMDRHTVVVKLKRTGAPVLVKTACSFTSYEGAMKNLKSEMDHWDFDRVRSELERVWERKLSQIRVEADSDEDKAKFYGAMYRASFLPHKINDVDGAYPKFADGSPVNDNHLTDFHLQLSQFDYYDDFSMWDTYRAQHPLLTILEPMRSGEMMQSLVRKYEQGGWLPIFPCWNSYTAAMIGDHCTAAIADAYVKGIRNFDVLTAYEAMRKNAFEEPATREEYCNGKGRRALRSYLDDGYIPLEDSVKEAFHQQEQVSRTLEYAYDDYALAQMAKELMNAPALQEAASRWTRIDRRTLAADYRELMRRSKNYRHVIDPKTGWANGRHRDGTFATPGDTQYIKEPEKHPEAKSLLPTVFSTFITEGTPVHYSWYVPHDVPGLIRAMGGKQRFEAKLDSMFAFGENQAAPLYWHGNEPCHQIAYLYDFISKPEKTARAVRHILSTEYLNAPGGLSGNDDAGQMSAWYIFSALGFYPVCPATPVYYLGSPMFSRAEIRLENGRTFTILAHGASEKAIYIQSMKLNGHRYTKPFIRHADIVGGGVLELEMREAVH
ncbi:MAG: GH92 family glycosyl hydrolase [Bacteroidaceae bacterium]|nr:GH92 family glycosyl hydrolase [Bacteroidaceae bacterium]